MVLPALTGALLPTEELFELVGVITFVAGDVKQERFHGLVPALVGVDAAFGYAEVFHLQGVLEVRPFFGGQAVGLGQVLSPPLICYL
jgi:hypothetical protein